MTAASATPVGRCARLKPPQISSKFDAYACEGARIFVLVLSSVSLRVHIHARSGLHPCVYPYVCATPPCRFYAYLDVRKLDKVPEMALQYAGRERLLRQRLRAKYSADQCSDEEQLLACKQAHERQVLMFMGFLFLFSSVRMYRVQVCVPACMRVLCACVRACVRVCVRLRGRWRGSEARGWTEAP